MNTVQMLNEGFDRKYLKEAEEEIKNQEETDEIEVGDLFLNGDETFKLLDIAMDEDGEVIVNAENEETGEEEEIEYAPVDLDDEEDEIIEEGIFGFGKKSPEQLKHEQESALKSAFRSVRLQPEIRYSSPRKTFIADLNDVDDANLNSIVKSVSASMKQAGANCSFKEDNMGNKVLYCQFKESVNRPTRKESYRRRLKESIKRVLRKMNEAQMSDEDRRDTDILRGIYAKSQDRKNAKLTPEEKSTLDKYNLYRDDWGAIRGDKAGLVKDKEIQQNYQGKNRLYNDKINLADRARKMDARDGGYEANNYWADRDPSREFKRNGKYVRLKGKGLLDRERALQNYKMGSKYDTMKSNLRDRKWHEQKLNDVDSDYDARMQKLQAEMDELQKDREWQRSYHANELDNSNSRINKLLKRESYLRESMRKYTKGQLADIVRKGWAEDISDYDFNQMDDFLKNHNLEKIGYSSGKYGINGGLLQDRDTGDWYAIVGRNSAVFQAF